MALPILPLEVLDHIFANVLVEVGLAWPKEILPLRVVNKFFNHSILRSLTNGSIRDRNGSFHSWLDAFLVPEEKRRRQSFRKMSPPILRHFIKAQIQSDVTSQAISSIRNVLQRLNVLCPVSAYELKKRTSSISETAADYLEWEIGSHELVSLTWPYSATFTRMPGQNEEDQSLLGAAIITGSIPTVQRLLTDRDTINVDHQSPYFGRPLHLAAYWSRLEILELLLAHGATPRKGQDPTAWNPVYYFQSTPWRDHYYSPHGTALEVAAPRGHIDIVRVLLQPCHKLNFDKGLASLHLATRGTHVAVIQALLEAFPKEFNESEKGRIFLQACSYGRLEVVKLMITLGVRLDYKAPK